MQTTSERWGAKPLVFRGVALFLALTGAIKVVSCLTETKLLATSDPLLQILTVRQVLFVAALLEILVARRIWSNQHDGERAWLTLWLSSIFVVYRVGLAAIGYRGRCSCLGNVADWLPGAARWVNPAMVTGLACMVSVGLFSLWQDSRPVVTSDAVASCSRPGL